MKRVFILLSPLIFFQCARQSQPQGGPQDKEAPELIASVPENGQKNFKGKTIELTFDEFVKLKDPKEEIIITPSAGSKTKFVAKKNKIVITPEIPWKDSTTYSIAFRGGVQDLNESNPAEDLHIAFSTGSTIDSLQIVGAVAEYFKEKIPQKITVAIYQSDTFDIFKHKPTYVSKTSKAGSFSLKNLKAGKYFIYAFEDKNKNFKVDSKSERFGYLIKEINLPQQTDSIQINLVRVDTRPIKLTSIRNTNTISIIRFNKPLSSISINAIPKKQVYSYGDNRSEVIVYKDFSQNDSLALSVTATDSLNHVLDTTVYVKYTETKKIQDKLKISEWQNNFNLETKQFETKTTINKLISKIVYDSIYIQIDSTNYQTIKPAEIEFDTLTKTLTIATKLKIEDKENIPQPIMLFGKGAFITIDNDSTKAQDLQISIPKLSETGTLLIEVTTNEPHFEVQLQNSKDIPIASFRDQKKFSFKYLIPGEYKILILVDKNENQSWDTGDFYKRTEPEKVVLYKNTENKSIIPIRANWEVGPLVITF